MSGPAENEFHYPSDVGDEGNSRYEVQPEKETEKVAWFREAGKEDFNRENEKRKSSEAIENIVCFDWNENQPYVIEEKSIDSKESHENRDVPGIQKLLHSQFPSRGLLLPLLFLVCL